MITEDYVSFETAKLLKEKGFDEETEHEMWYVIKQFSTGCHWNSCTYKVGDITREYDDGCCIAMPTLQMTMKWLREKHNQNVTVKAINNVARLKTIYYAEVQNLLEPGENGFCVNGCIFKDSYEEAVEYAINYCLENLI